MKTAGKRVFFTSTMQTPFILDDLELLRRHFEVDSWFGHGPLAVGSVFLRAMRAHLSFSWFGSTYSAAMVLGARLTGSRSVIVVGGVDASRVDEWRYGLWTNRWKAALLRRALEHCDLVFVVDNALKADLERLSGRVWKHVERLPTGFDPQAWTPSGARERAVLCVAKVDTDARMRIKGIPVLIEAAVRLPDVPFRIVGVPGKLSKGPFPPNVQFIPPVPRAELLGFYRGARVYCQPSRREGLPNTLCEAMLCGCVPVGTRVGGIPTAIDRFGFLVEYGDVDGLVHALEQALSAPESLGLEGRSHIAAHFNKSVRDARLLARLQELLA